MQTYYSFKQDGDLLLNDALKELDKSVLRSYDLYISLFCLFLSFREYAANKIELRQNKQLPTKEDLNPNIKFINNIYFSKIRNHSLVEKYYNKKDFNWENYPELIRNLWIKIENSDFYSEYMSSGQSNLKEDKNIFKDIANTILSNNEELDNILEDSSIYWNDDLEFLLGIIIKNINFTQESDDTVQVDQIYKSNDDKNFAHELLRKTILNSEKYDSIIGEFLQKWDLNRIAFLDKIILHLALCELLEMPEIPVKVAINEYLDIAKYYSTQKSNNFINGILDAVYNQHKDAGTLNKTGKGLIC